MWARLSDDIVFEAAHSPEGLTRSPNVQNWVEQQLITGLPILQPTYTKLKEVQLRCKFSVSIAPYKKLYQALSKAASNGEILTWVTGTGENRGNYVITDWDEDVLSTWIDSMEYSIEIKISLKEYTAVGAEGKIQAAARANAFATKYRPKVDVPALKPALISELDNNIKITKVEARKMVKKLNKLKAAVISFEKYKRDIIAACAKIQKAKQAADTAISILKNLKNSPNLSTAFGNMSVATGSMATSLGAAGSLAGIPGPGVITLNQLAVLTSGVGASVGSVGMAASPMQWSKSWWKISPFIH
jgi:phage protein U